MSRGRDASHWEQAESLEDLLGLSRRFVAGDLDYFPGWMSADMDEESDSMEATLIAANQAGMLTVASQPGAPFGPGHDGLIWGGRAFVGGFAAPAHAEAIERRAEGEGLWILKEKDEARHDSVPAGLRDGTPYLVLGRDAGASELEIFAEDVGESALAALHDAVFIWVVDPVWGRRERLRAAF